MTDEPAHPKGDNQPPVIVELTPELAAFLDAYVDGHYLATLTTLTERHTISQLAEMTGKEPTLTRRQAMMFVDLMEPLKAIRAAVRKGIKNDLS